MRVLSMPEDQIKPFNSDGHLFQNLNTPEDVKEVHSLKFKV